MDMGEVWVQLVLGRKRILVPAPPLSQLHRGNERTNVVAQYLTANELIHDLGAIRLSRRASDGYELLPSLSLSDA